MMSRVRLWAMMFLWGTVIGTCAVIPFLPPHASAGTTSTACAMYDAAGTTTVTLTTAGTYYQQLDGWLNGNQQGGCIHNASDGGTSAGTLRAQQTGLYVVSLGVSGSLNGNAIVHSAIYVNGTKKDNCEFEQNMTTSTSQRGAVTCLLNLAVNDLVDVRHSSDTNTRTLTIMHSNLAMWLLMWLLN